MPSSKPKLRDGLGERWDIGDGFSAPKPTATDARLEYMAHLVAATLMRGR